MASTSTNKQPLLGDRPFNLTVDLRNRYVSDTSNGIDVGGDNAAIQVVDCTQNDGALVDSAAAITREYAGPGYEVYMWLSVANDFLRPSQSEFIGNFVASSYNSDGTVANPTAALGRTEYKDFPELLRPVPKVGSFNEAGTQVAGTYYRGLYVPKGKCLWVACKKHDANDTTVGAPLFGCQGVYF